MSAMWGGRFAGELDPEFARFNQSTGVDHRLRDADVAGSIAWAVALGDAEVLRKTEVRKIVAGLRKAAKAEASMEGHEDVHSWVEHELRKHVGDLAGKLHTGRSRNDQVATDLKLYLKDFCEAQLAQLQELIGALVALAEKHADLPLPGYTHLQRAQPITAGHHALAYVEMLARDHGRLRDAMKRMDTCPLGSAALAGTAFAVDRAALARDLGFAGGPTRNSLDAVSDRDHALELAFCCANTMQHLSRLAEDWIFFASQEAGFLHFSDAVSTGSSLMPQKKNPDAMELVRGKAGRVFGALQSLLVTMKGLPLAYNKDMQEDKEPLFDALDTTRACLAVCTTTVRTARFDAARCKAAASQGYTNATDVADVLVAHDVPFRKAHERTGRAVRRALELGVELEELPEEEQRSLFPELRTKLARELTVTRVLARRRAVGGTAPARVRAEVRRWKKQLAAWGMA